VWFKELKGSQQKKKEGLNEKSPGREGRYQCAPEDAKVSMQ
jgi:hypothetical protein